MVESGDIYSTIQKKTPSNIRSSLNHSRDEIVFTSVKNEGNQKKRNVYLEEDEEEPIYATIDKKTTLRKLEDDCYSDEEDELMAHIEDCEDLAMEALDTAAVAVTGDSTFIQRRYTAHNLWLQTNSKFIFVNILRLYFGHLHQEDLKCRADILISCVVQGSFCGVYGLFCGVQG